MSTILDTDLWVINRGGVLYRSQSVDALDDALPTDSVVVYRANQQFNCEIGNLDDKLLDSDHLFCQRGGTMYRVSGEDFRDYFSSDSPTPTTGIIVNPGYTGIADDVFYDSSKTQTLEVASSTDLPWGANETLYMTEPGSGDPSAKAYYTPQTSRIVSVATATGTTFGFKTIPKGGGTPMGGARWTSEVGSKYNVQFGTKVGSVPGTPDNGQWYGIDLRVLAKLKIKYEASISDSRYLTMAYSNDGTNYTVDNLNGSTHEITKRTPISSLKAARYWVCFNAEDADEAQGEIDKINDGTWLTTGPVYFFSLNNWNVLTETLYQVFFEDPNPDLKFFQRGEKVSTGGTVYDVDLAGNTMFIEGGTRPSVASTISSSAAKSGTGRNLVPPSSSNNFPQLAGSNGEWIDNTNRLGKEFAISSHQWNL